MGRSSASSTREQVKVRDTSSPSRSENNNTVHQEHSSPSSIPRTARKQLSIDLRYAQQPYPSGKDRSTASHMTFSRSWLIQCANSTVQIGHEGYYTNSLGERIEIGEALEHAVRDSVHYHSSHTFEQHALPSSSTSSLFDTQFRVCYGSPLNVATQLRHEFGRAAHVAVLNSASSKHPGGKFFRGTISTEDCICRASLLYHCLVQYSHREHHFYMINSKAKYQQSSSSCAIFSPHVPVIRHDTLRGEFLDTPELFSFVSIPAPNAFVLGREDAEDHDDAVTKVPRAQTPGASNRGETQFEYMSLDEALRDRCYRALCIFAEHGVTDVVLCAFGCGVHGNDPKVVASCFRDILQNELRNKFRTVAFAILKSRPMNYEAFSSIFPEAKLS